MGKVKHNGYWCKAGFSVFLETAQSFKQRHTSHYPSNKSA